MSILLLAPLVSAGCLFPDSHYVYASNLTRPGKASLLLWPDDRGGAAFRWLVCAGESIGWGLAPLLHGDTEEPLAEIDGEVAAVAVLVPVEPRPELLTRSLELLEDARTRFPGASFHHVRVRTDLTRIDRGRHLMAKLREVGAASRTVSAFDGLAALSRFNVVWYWPKRVVTARRTEHGIEWVHVDASGPPEVVRVGDLGAVLDDLSNWQNVFLVRPEDAPAGLTQAVVDFCESRPEWSAHVITADTFLWSFDDAELDEEALARLYPGELSDLTREPLRVSGRLLLDE